MPAVITIRTYAAKPDRIKELATFIERILAPAAPAIFWGVIILGFVLPAIIRG